jgi:hypothetical protein
MRRFLAAGMVLAGLSGAHVARANCARPVGYVARPLEDAGVVIEPENFDGRGCPDTELLRQNLATGEVVRIDTCEAADAGHESRGFVDQCVGPGTYRYGFAKPYECVASACSTDYFDEIVVTTPLAPGCRAYATAPSVPWGSSARICSYGSYIVAFSLAFFAVVALLVGVLFYAIVRVLRRRRAAP